MEQRVLGGSSIAVSAIGFGTWQLNNRLWDGPDAKASVRLVQTALAAGCYFFDVAPGYGDGAAETLLGQALHGRRHESVICTKFGHGGPKGEDFSIAGLRASLEGSLKRLQTDYVDLLLLHNPPAGQRWWQSSVDYCPTGYRWRRPPCVSSWRTRK